MEDKRKEYKGGREEKRGRVKEKSKKKWEREAEGTMKENIIEIFIQTPLTIYFKIFPGNCKL